MDTLENAVLGQRPRILVYISVESARGKPVKHYFTNGSITAAKPQLWLVYPSQSAPRHTPPLCIVYEQSQDAFENYVAPIQHYSAIAKGQDRPTVLGCDCNVIKRWSRKLKAAPEFPASWSDEQVLQYLKRQAPLPSMFEVRYTTSSLARIPARLARSRSKCMSDILCPWFALMCCKIVVYSCGVFCLCVRCLCTG